MRNYQRWTVVGCQAVLVLFAGAGAVAQDGIKVYRVPKEQSPAPGLVPVSESVLPRLTYQTPEGWTELPAGQMRLASFKVQADGKVADVSVIPLPGVAGGDLPNVNRWRGQVGLGDLTEEELAKAATKLEIAGQPALLHEMAGTNPSAGDATRILGAIQHRDGMAWFFKMTGDDQLVAKHRRAFLEFLKSVKFEARKPGELPPDHPPLPASSLPPGHPEITSSASGKTEPAAAGKLKWTVPAGWQEIPGGQFLYAKFTIVGDAGAQAAVNVSTSTGDGGGLAANVNRWRGQLGQSPWNEAELQKQIRSLAANGNQIQFVEMNGTDARSGQPAALVGAIVPQGGSTWFYKLMGDARIVGAQKEAFNSFVKGVKY
jgi:hypothetical protein